MRALRRHDRKLGGLGVERLAVKRERLRVAERCAQIVDEFEGRRLALSVIEAEGAKIIRTDARHQTELHAAAEHLIDDRNLFGEPQRMIERHDVTHRPDAHPFGARAGADGIEARRRHPALVGTEMMLDAERMIEPDLVAQFQLAPELLVALMRRHAGLGPDMGKVREFHEATAGSIRYFADSCRADLPAVAAKQRRLVPVEGIEPPLLAEHDFESCASTSSATRACGAIYIRRPARRAKGKSGRRGSSIWRSPEGPESGLD